MKDLYITTTLSIIVWLIVGLYLWYRYGPDIYLDQLIANLMC
jgi:hypothetical protein